MDNIIEVKDLVKTYTGGATAVDGASLTVVEGEFFAFLGPNGAGKSTLINMMCGILQPTSGTIKILGEDTLKNPSIVKNNIGIVFQSSVLDDKQTVRENLWSRAALYNMPSSTIDERVQELTKLFELETILKRKYAQLSGGQRRRVDIARAMINSPRLLVLDEPTTGLDPQTRRIVWNVIKQVKERNRMTVFLTTHYMEESEQADNIAVIDGGKIVCTGSPAYLKQKYSYDLVRLLCKSEDKVIEYLDKNGIEHIRRGGTIECKINSGLNFLPHLNAIKDSLENFEVLKGNMDTVFLNITGRGLRDE